ncbi:unnamed protein product [Ambrosiozyma monospora]|uniref:Unnamed protein product n=1 Tax=Ambrosiozyma monospora TaxID=43982 RepID=A0ACB5UAY4_AMBMO|nr:unnamed protein product [Ambrosiozyma monospora]
MRVNIFRLYYTVLRCLKREQTTPGILETYTFPESQEDVNSIDYFNRLIEAIHNLTDLFVNSFPRHRDKMVFSQFVVFLGYQMGIFLSFFSHCDDPVKAQLMKDDMKRLYPIMEENLDLVSWGMSDFAFFYFKGLVENHDFAAKALGSWRIFKDNSILLRTAYRIPKLRLHAKKAMGCFASVLDENFEGSYKGVIFINRKSEKKLQHQTPIETVKDPSLRSYLSANVSGKTSNGKTTSDEETSSAHSPSNTSEEEMATTNNNTNVELESPNNVIDSNHHSPAPANVVPSINSIINHMVDQ